MGIVTRELRDEAERLIRARAHPCDTNPGLLVVHVRRGGEAWDWALVGALQLVGKATSIRWADTADRHDLAVSVGQDHWHLDVPNPGRAT